MSLFKFIKNKESIEDQVRSYGENIKIKKIDFNSIIFSPFAQLKCMNCGMFRRNYRCLCNITWNKHKEKISKYNSIYLIYIQVNNKERIEHLKKHNEENINIGKKPLNDWNLHKFACDANQVVVVSIMKKLMIYLKSRNPDKKLMLLNGGGGCRGCKVCGLIKPFKTGEKITPCKKTNESFTSPEALGIDVYATLQKNDIKFSVIPKYELICVGMVFEKI